MPKITVKQVLNLARKQIGTKATNYRRCKYNTWYYGREVSGDEYHWCVVFIQWLFAMLGAAALLFTKTANVGAQAVAFKNKGKLVTKNYKPGDLLIFHWSNKKSTWISGVYTLDHIGILEKVNADGSYTTIEGNTGDSTNGEVMRRTRYASQISCACRPDYADAVEDSDDNTITEDGVWGVETTTRAQEVFGTPVDGKVSNQVATFAKKNPGLLSSTFEWENSPKGGSQLIKAIQKKIGMSKSQQDGEMGPVTIKAMQKFFGTPVDGCVDNPSKLVKAFQKWLNKQ